LDEGPQLEGVERAGADGVDATGEGLTGHTRAAFKSFSHSPKPRCALGSPDSGPAMATLERGDLRRKHLFPGLTAAGC